MIVRPKDKREYEKREANGIIRASRFVRKYAHTKKELSVNVFRLIHKEIFKEAWSDIAGEYRIEKVKISGSSLILPHFSKVPGLMKEVDNEFKNILISVKDVGGLLLEADKLSEDEIVAIDKVIGAGSWIHHRITSIHPFREGNGRTARLAANLIFQRYGLVGLSVQVEKENKKRYRGALRQIDKEHD